MWRTVARVSPRGVAAAVLASSVLLEVAIMPGVGGAVGLRGLERSPEERRADLLADRQMRLAFLRGSHFGAGLAGRRPTLTLVRPDGRIERPLFRPRSAVQRFAWLNRGTAVYFVLDRSPSYLVLTRNGHLRRASDGICPSSPDPAADGTHLHCGDTLVFVRRGERSETLPIEVGQAFSPSLSPNGKRVAFVWVTPADEASLWVYDVRTKRNRELVRASSFPYEAILESPVWSPDGQRLLFWAWRDDWETVFTVDANGTHFRRLLKNAARPAWSPDGTRIAFDRDRGHGRQIYTARPDGGDVRQLTHGPKEAWAPRWRPAR